MNWYIRLASGIRYFRIMTPGGTRVLRAMDPDHIRALYDVLELEEIDREEAARWDAAGGAIQHVYSHANASHANNFRGQGLNRFSSPLRRRASGHDTAMNLPVIDSWNGMQLRPVGDSMNSIGASLYGYEILDGIREIPVSMFSNTSISARNQREHDYLRDLAQEIQTNQSIEPLVVVFDDDPSPYILEGVHRFDSLIHHLGAQTLPALVVLDQTEWPSQEDSSSSAQGESSITAKNRTLVREGGMKHVPAVSVRQFEQVLSNLGFVVEGTAGSHTKWYHRDYPDIKTQTIQGKDGNKRMFQHTMNQLGFAHGDIMNVIKSKGKGWEAPVVTQRRQQNEQEQQLPLLNDQPQEFMYDPHGPDGWKNYDPRFNKNAQINRKHAQVDLLSVLNGMRGTLAQAAQKIYDAWDQDDDGYDEVVGTGGICQDIAEEFCSILSSANIDCTTLDAQIGDQHVWAVAYDPQSEEAYMVDIPASYYETGGGYTWQKIPNVSFDESFIIIEPMSYGDLRASEGVY
jgi:predicted RNA binding protein YcfA (HicA-like mRNA interferase family)